MAAAMNSPSPLAFAKDSIGGSRVESWLDDSKWPIPTWYTTPSDRAPSFETFLTRQLRTRYVELEGDFRSIVGNFPPDDAATAQAVFGYLQAARPALEPTRPDHLTVSSTLNQIERYMVWLCPPHIIYTRITSTLLKLDELRPNGWKRYAAELTSRREDITEARAPLDEAIGACNRVLLAEQIGSGLQIRRLRAFRAWGLLMLALFFVATPLLAQPDALEQWPIDRLVGAGRLFSLWLNTLAVLIVGMMGGFLSGLLQSRSSRVSLSDYQETMLKLVLRPMVGGIISLVLIVLMSWNLIPAIEVKNVGAYILAAFLSGFSERYFLRLLDLRDEDDGDTPVSTGLANRADLGRVADTENPQSALAKESR